MKRTLSALLVFVLAFIMCFSVCAVTLDVAENAADVTVVSEADLAEDTTPTYKPGLNIYTGTTAPFDFEGIDTSISTKVKGNTNGGEFNIRDKSVVTVSSASFDTKANDTNANNTAVLLTGSYPHFTFESGVLPVIEAERPVRIYLKYCGDTNSQKLSLIRNSLNETTPVLTNITVNDTSGNWVAQTYYINSNNVAVSNKGKPSEYYKDDTKNIKSLAFMKPANNTAKIWVDDISLIPYYKITYIGLDGNVAAVDYALDNGSGALLEYYIPNISLVEGANAFSLEKDGEKVYKVKLENKDITLYQIDQPEVVIARSDNDRKVYALTEDTFTFPAIDDVFEGVKNFNYYSDGTTNYNAGATVAASAVAGKTFTPICINYKKFDDRYGELALYINYDLVDVNTVTGHSGSGNIIPAYVNSEYITSGVTHTDGNGVYTYEIVEVDGRRVLKLTTMAYSNHNYWRMNFTAATVAKYTAFESAKAEDTQGEKIANLFGTPWHRFTYGANNNSQNLSKPTDKWTTQSTSSWECPEGGINGSGFSYTRAANNKTPNIYKDDYALYVWPVNATYFRTTYESEECTKVEFDTAATEFTLPTLESLGYEVPENYLGKWTDGDNYYDEGQKVAISVVKYNSFYPLCQSAEEPAMGFTFEGDVKESANEVSKPIYANNIVDDGRDVLLVHWYNGYTNSSNTTTYPTDLRLSFKTSTYSHPEEYNLVQYSVKVPMAWDVVTDGTIVKNNSSGKPYWADKTQTPGCTSLASKNYRIYTHTTAGGSYTSPVIMVKSETINMSDDYYVKEYDMSSDVNFTHLGGYGFCVDPLQATYGAYVYMDYLRVYRRGIQTITYATNAPVGATVVKEVAADKNRGLGYGYLLKDVRPEVKGYVFLGWGLTPDATETVNSITVDGNETVYAVWAKADTVDYPEVTDEVEIRGNGENNGIRFKSAIKPSVKANLDEFGFLATREALLPYADAEKTTRNYNYLTFNHKVNGADANYYVQGIAYDADGGIDKENGNNTDGSTVYTAVLSGIPMENKNEKMVVRSYAKYTVNGKEMVVYGNTNAASLYETAVAIKEAGGTAYTNNKTYIDEIVG